jgi:ubiquinone/menaquinone biosynthesis C-methylase UbiE
MSWFDLPRVPELEVMADVDEVNAYSSSAAEEYLSRIDDTFIEHALRLAGRSPGCALDIGAGPGQIVLKLARRLPGWRFIGLDLSEGMVRAALASAAESNQPSAAPPSGPVAFLAAGADHLPFSDCSFDLVLCNSVLHHAANPGRLFAEIARVARPTGAILLRDLRRPSRFGYPFHVRWHGRHYSRLMYKLYCDSVRAAYKQDELASMLRASPIAGARLFTHRGTHLGLERPRT